MRILYLSYIFGHGHGLIISFPFGGQFNNQIHVPLDLTIVISRSPTPTHCLNSKWLASVPLYCDAHLITPLRGCVFVRSLSYPRSLPYSLTFFSGRFSILSTRLVWDNALDFLPFVKKLRLNVTKRSIGF